MTKAKILYQQAATYGLPQAQCKLGYMYCQGNGVVLNYQNARDLFERATARGHSKAMCQLGLLYEEGKGVEQD